MGAKVISVCLQKGGVAKTTTTATIASIMGLQKHQRVLVIDFDGQGTLTYYSNVNERLKGILDVLTGDCNIEDAIIHDGDVVAVDRMVFNHYDLLTGDKRLYNLDRQELDADDILLLKNRLDEVKDQYDYILIDTPPSLGNSMMMALTASDYVLLPTDSTPFAVKGIVDWYETFKAVRSQINNDLSIIGVLMVKFSNRTKVGRIMAEQIDTNAKAMGTSIFKHSIREGVAVKEAQLVPMQLIDYAPRSNPCIDYIGATTELLERTERG